MENSKKLVKRNDFIVVRSTKNHQAKRTDTQFFYQKGAGGIVTRVGDGGVFVHFMWGKYCKNSDMYLSRQTWFVAHEDYVRLPRRNVIQKEIKRYELLSKLYKES